MANGKGDVLLSPRILPTLESEDPGQFDGPFEGPEKLLEIWFTPSVKELPRSRHPNKPGLKSVSRASWDGLMDLIGCKVLSVMVQEDEDDDKGEKVEAYLLSESSMFIFPHKLILKTCGTTTLLVGLEKILTLAKEEAGIPSVFRVFYSRKTFMNPHLQKPPHRNWKDEVVYLDEHFLEGSAYTVGRMNGDHWLLWMTNPPSSHRQVDKSPSSVARFLPLETTPVTQGQQDVIQDETLEILMSDLDPEAMRPFFAQGDKAGHEAGKALSKDVGLSALFEEALLDSYLFTPCGYSANGVLGEHYFTVHVTPEPGSSYASFECNVTWTRAQLDSGDALARKDLEELIAKVLSIFKPGHFSLTRFISQDDVEGDVHGHVLALPKVWVPTIANYKRTDRIVYEFDGYELVFGSYKSIKV